MCDRHNKNYYKKYKKWCDRYFYLHHRKEARGIGEYFLIIKMIILKKILHLSEMWVLHFKFYLIKL